MLKRARESVALALAAGMMIGIGGTVNLKLGGASGAVLFAVALLTICMLGLHLFTGKVGALVYSNNKRQDSVLLLTCLVGNLAGTFLTARLAYLACDNGMVIRDNAIAMCNAKLERTPAAFIASAFFCGVLMYVAVTVFARKQSIAGIVFCVPVFILSGYEHSIADMYYFFTADMYTVRALAYIVLAVIGNALGAWSIPAMKKLAGAESD